MDIHDELTSSDARLARQYLRRIIGFLLVGATIIGTVIWATRAHAKPLYEAKSQGTSIVLYDETCALPAVTNLVLRAVWVQDGKSYEGCWGATPPLGVVMAYFSDKTVAAIPISAFERVVGI